jgi:hypothetical protein
MSMPACPSLFLLIAAGTSGFHGASSGIDRQIHLAGGIGPPKMSLHCGRLLPKKCRRCSMRNAIFIPLVDKTAICNHYRLLIKAT